MGSKLPFIVFFAALFLFDFFIAVTPYLAASGSPYAEPLYAAFGPTCHQLTSRSLCLFVSKSDGSYSIGDCLPSDKLQFTKENTLNYADRTGYKFPVCARDIGIYFAMLLGMMILPFIQKIESEDWPNKWILVAAAVPIAIDGTTQLFGLRESDNALRLWTGFIIGVVLPFYLQPILNSLYIFISGKIKAERKNKN
ncbi:MAG: DUF2085 domain-containing protein [Candidatus Micrarchaeota archaeon]|nr:DUF2085 domain-containing protein [Candidatus Micrarchaeota archaeon]